GLFALLAWPKRRRVGEDLMAQFLARWPITVAAVAMAMGLPGAAWPQSSTKPTLDYEFYKAKVEPIFLKKKAGHVRCVICHADNNSAFHLEPLAKGAKGYTDAQSRKNFETVSKLVNPGEPMVSRLTMHPLAPEGGGDVFHSGGRQFMSTNDPDWKTL